MLTVIFVCASLIAAAVIGVYSAQYKASKGAEQRARYLSPSHRPPVTLPTNPSTEKLMAITPKDSVPHISRTELASMLVVRDIFADGGDINDIAHLREQDQGIAQLGAQLDKLLGSPWVEVDAKEMYDAEVQNKSMPVRRVVQQLGCMSVPPAIAGTHQSSVGVGMATIVQMGDRAVTVPSRDYQKTLILKLNGDYARVIGSRQRAIIASLHEYAKSGQVDAILPSADYGLALRANKTYVICSSEEDRQALKQQLDSAYAAATKDPASLIMAELLHATRPGMGPDMRERG